MNELGSPTKDTLHKFIITNHLQLTDSCGPHCGPNCGPQDSDFCSVLPLEELADINKALTISSQCNVDSKTNSTVTHETIHLALEGSTFKK